MPKIFIPPLLRQFADGLEEVDVEGRNVREAIENLDLRFPGMADRLRQGDGLKPGLNVAVGNKVSSLGLLQKLSADSEVHFLPAIGGG